MPLYQFRNKDTLEEWEDIMSISSKAMFLEENPHIEQVVCAPMIVSGVSGITHKVDSGFKDVLSRIGNANPHSPLGHEHGDKGIKATKVREVVQKQKARQNKST